MHLYTLSLHDALPISAAGKNTPAPWVPYTRAGCNFGAVATANTILENTAVDVAKVFGPTSPQEQEVISNPPPSTDRKSTRLNSSHVAISYAVFCLKNK